MDVVRNRFYVIVEETVITKKLIIKSVFAQSKSRAEDVALEMSRPLDVMKEINSYPQETYDIALISEDLKDVNTFLANLNAA